MNNFVITASDKWRGGGGGGGGGGGVGWRIPGTLSHRFFRKLNFVAQYFGCN
jgi:hypothetical protein